MLKNRFIRKLHKNRINRLLKKSIKPFSLSLLSVPVPNLIKSFTKLDTSRNSETFIRLRRYSPEEIETARKEWELSRAKIKEERKLHIRYKRKMKKYRRAIRRHDAEGHILPLPILKPFDPRYFNKS